MNPKMQEILKKIYPHALVVLGFVIIALFYFYPVLQGKKIFQSDIVQYTGMAKEQKDFRATANAEPYWTNSAFGGMPTYQLGAQYPNDFIGELDSMLRFLPRPADYLFLYFLGFYVLLLVVKADPLKAFFGALAFGFSTYLIVILGVGHNAKAHAIAYMPLVVAGVIMVFQRQYIFGGILTMFAVALEINANHFQMTYYLLIVLIGLGIYYGIKMVKEQVHSEWVKIASTFILAVVLALGANATSLLATQEYAAFSTRGKSTLKLDPLGKPKTATTTLDRSYITEYSYGIAESFNLIAPRLFGGGNDEKLSDDSSVYNFMLNYGANPTEARQFTDGMARTYWGDQPIVAAPAYIGAIVFFLFVLALYHDKRQLKWVFLGGAFVSLLLSWGKNCSVVTDFFIDYVPLYDKFRAVSSIQVILELCVPVLAVMGLHSFMTTNQDKRWDSLKKTGMTCLVLIGLLFLMQSQFDFTGPMDSEILRSLNQFQDKQFGLGFIEALQKDRMTMYAADLLRSTIFMAVAFVVLWRYSKDKLAVDTAVIGVGLLMVVDLFWVDKKYVNSDDFVSAHQVEQPFEITPVDEQILQDSTYYRVLEVEGNMNSARASFFHKSIGGYSAVKPRAIQELFDYQIAKNNSEVIDMLNVKYIIQVDEKGEQFPTVNKNANGNAWFVSKLIGVENDDAVMKSLDKLSTKEAAVYNKADFKVAQSAFVKDSTATIELLSYQPNHLKYASNNQNKGFAVFSEMYYKNGWNAYIDGKLTDYMKVDFALRGMNIPAGKHQIEFKFEPEVVKTGSRLSMVSFLLMLVVTVVGINYSRKKLVNQ
jgi:hypothetical protein